MSFRWLAGPTGLSRYENQAKSDQCHLPFTDPGELNRRIKIRLRVDEPTLILVRSRHIRSRLMSGQRWLARRCRLSGLSADRKYRYALFTIRFRHDITADHEVVYYGQSTGSGEYAT